MLICSYGVYAWRVCAPRVFKSTKQILIYRGIFDKTRRPHSATIFCLVIQMYLAHTHLLCSYLFLRFEKKSYNESKSRIPCLHGSIGIPRTYRYIMLPVNMITYNQVFSLLLNVPVKKLRLLLVTILLF